MIENFSFVYECELHVNNKVSVRVIHPDDVCGLVKKMDIFKVAVRNRVANVSLLIRPIYNYQFDLFSYFVMVDHFYSSLVELTNNYSSLSPEFKEEFSEDFLVELRQKVFNVSLFNKI